MRKLAYLLLVAALAAGGWWAWRQQEAVALPDYIATSNGRLEMNRIDVATLYPVAVAHISVNDGRIVLTKGWYSLAQVADN